MFELIFKFFSNKNLTKYTAEKVIDYTNSLSADIQRNVELSIKDDRSKEIAKLANVMNSISGSEKSQELPLVTKLKAESDDVPDLCATNGVNFK